MIPEILIDYAKRLASLPYTYNNYSDDVNRAKKSMDEAIDYYEATKLKYENEIKQLDEVRNWLKENNYD